MFKKVASVQSLRNTSNTKSMRPVNMQPVEEIKIEGEIDNPSKNMGGSDLSD